MMTAFNLTEDQAITAITVGVDFSVSQVVNGNWGMQTIIPKVCLCRSHPSTPSVHAHTGVRESALFCPGEPIAVALSEHADTRFSRIAAALGPRHACSVRHVASSGSVCESVRVAVHHS